VSIKSQRPVIDEIMTHFPHTLALAVAGMLISVVAGVILGVAAAKWRNKWVDVLILNISTVGMAIPSFWLALLMLMLFSVKLRWFPTFGAGSPGDLLSQLRALTLPAFALGIAGMVFIARITRSSMLDILREDYVRTARAKGVSEKIVLFKHTLKNAAIPIVTVIGFYFGIFVSGGVVMETIFARPGLGKLLVDAVFGRDYSVIQGVVLFIVIIFVIVNLLTDLIYSLLDPRVRQE
jgi:ABC-type dipeptide/oligopeptide/nickel transport system permease component